jgi:hypothetical protein
MCGTSWNRRTTPQADAAPSALPDMSANVSHVTRRIRRCENEPAAQLVLEHFAKEYARAAIAAGGAQEPKIGMLEALAIVVVDEWNDGKYDEPALQNAIFDLRQHLITTHPTEQGAAPAAAANGEQA